MATNVRLHRVEGHPVTLHFSPGYAARARALGALVAEAHRFLAGWLGVEAHTTLSLLRRESWHRLRRAPYGYPHSNPQPATIFAPAHYPPRLLAELRAMHEGAPPAVQQRLAVAGEPLEAQITTFYDLVAIHELAHLFIHHLRLALGPQWLVELVANLFATAFFVEVRPPLAHCWLAWAEIQASQQVPHQSLAAFEQGQGGAMRFANAAWYQGRFIQEAHRLWQAQGRALAPALVARFSLHPSAAAARFQQLDPEFRW